MQDPSFTLGLVLGMPLGAFLWMKLRLLIWRHKHRNLNQLPSFGVLALRHLRKRDPELHRQLQQRLRGTK